MKCSSCGAQIAENARYCSYCGTEARANAQPVYQQPEPIIHVHNHYYQQPDESYSKVIYLEPQKSSKSRLMLLLLFWFAGVLGGHKFYSGKIGTGFLYLFTGGLFGIGLIVDFFSILFGSPTDQDGLPIKWL